MNLDNQSISRSRLGRYKEKGMVYVSLGINTKKEVERLSSLDGMNVSDFIRGLIQREIGRREANRNGSYSSLEKKE